MKILFGVVMVFVMRRMKHSQIVQKIVKKTVVPEIVPGRLVEATVAEDPVVHVYQEKSV